MLKKVIKLFLILVLAWLMSFLSILREFKNGTLNIWNDNWLRDNELKMFRKQHGDGRISKFEAWDLLGAFSPTMSFEETLKQLSSYSLPLGVNGTPVHVNSHLKISVQAVVSKGWEDHAFNQFVSDAIPLNRTLPDVRDDRCKSITYQKNLPQASVIICFHNEAWSTLLRTIYSVFDRSPPELLNEIILIDDFSTMDIASGCEWRSTAHRCQFGRDLCLIGDVIHDDDAHLKTRLDAYVQKFPKVKLVRTSRREGLVRARLMGVKLATSSVIVFLDSHCECAQGWLEPLLDRIRTDPKTVASPVVDHILDSTFEYVSQDIYDLRVGGFTWDLNFIWTGIPYSLEAQRTGMVSPVKTPTISGGLFAIDKKYFEELGYYDEGFEIWGGDNLEISFKVWMCGGTLEIVPCSHVGHVFRKRFPYTGFNKHIKINLVRVAEVWMDDYAKYFYARINNRKGNFGNVTERKQLRKRLNCKSFQWYLKNIYPEIEIPDNLVANGQIISLSKHGFCLDAPNLVQKVRDDVKLIKCHLSGGNQYWAYANDGELRRDNMCLDYMYGIITIFFCKRAPSQIWLFDDKTHNIRHVQTQKCLTVKEHIEGRKIILEKCNGKLDQKWFMENFMPERLIMPDLQNYTRNVEKSNFYLN